MPTEILMPALSPTMEDGTLAKWLVSEGDRVSAGDILAEIETDKATMEFEAVEEGILGRILVPEGRAGIAVNTPIALLLEPGEPLPPAEETGGKDRGAAPPPAATADVPARPRADASAPESHATAAPAPAGLTAESPPPSAGTPPPAGTGAAPRAPEGHRVFASPLARRLAAEAGLDLAGLTGSGPRGRIVKADVEAARHAPQPGAAQAAPADTPPSPPPATTPDARAVAQLYADRPHREIALDGMRRTVAARLTEAKQTIPHFYLRRSVRLDALMALRSELNAALAPRGIRLSVNDFIIKACASALQQVPGANAVWAGDRILQIGPSDIAVAVAVEGGLFTPVLRDAQQKPLTALSTEMADLARRARDRSLAPQDYQGGSFAISNLGMHGIESFDAVINPPQAAILAVGAASRNPVVEEDGALAVATTLALTLSVDHRVIDGALGAELLAAIVGALEAPLLMLA